MSGIAESSGDSADQWISNVIAKAQDNNPLAAEESLARIANLLKGQFSERNLTKANLESVATLLLRDILCGHPELEDNHEN